MGSSKGGGSVKAPNLSKDYESGIKIAMKYLPQQLQQELAMRQQYDPQYIEQALGLQGKYDPALAQQQLDALQRRDPQWLALHGALGDKVKEALDRGYVDPRQEAAYNQLSGLAGKVDPRYEAAYNKLSGLAGQVDPTQAAAYQRAGALAGISDPTRAAEYKALGQQVTGDTLRGTTADPATLKQMTQAIMSRQPNLSYGEAQNMAAAVYTGQRGQALQQQRQGAGEQFLGQQSTAQQQQQSANQFYSMPSLMQQRQQSLGAFSNILDPTRMSQQSLGQFYGMNAPEMQAYGLAGTFIQPSNSTTNAINSIQGVTPPSDNRYVNPNAGYQGAQYGLQNYQNQLAQNQMQNSSNPWMGALSGAASGASAGTAFGGAGYGTAIGAGIGAIGGYLGYSDVRLKQNITRAGTVTPDGIPIVEFSYKGSDKRWKGVVGQDVLKVRPDAVFKIGEYLMVDYHKLGIKMEEV